jgi:hypothetical protein
MGRRPIAGGYDEKSVGRAIVGKPTLSPFPGHSGPHTFAFLSCVWRARGIISMPPLFDDVMSNGRQCRIVQATSGRHKALFLDSTDSRGRRVHKCLSTDPQKRISVVADVLPRAVGFKHSHECHMFAGVNTDVDEARLNGPLTVRGNPCICVECKAERFNSCLMKHIIGPVRRVKVPREKNETSQLRQLESLHTWAASLKAKQLIAMRADDPSIEGLYWLAQLLA